MKKLLYTFKNDTLFKMLFMQYPELMKELHDGERAADRSAGTGQR